MRPRLSRDIREARKRKSSKALGICLANRFFELGDLGVYIICTTPSDYRYPPKFVSQLALAACSGCDAEGKNASRFI